MNQLRDQFNDMAKECAWPNLWKLTVVLSAIILAASFTFYTLTK